MTYAATYPAPAPFGRDPLSAVFRGFRGAVARLPVADVVVAAFLFLSAAAIVSAEERLQDWVPDVLVMPDDSEVIMERAIGSSVRMLSIATNADIDALFAEWERDLSENGFPIKHRDSEVLERSIEFSGPGITNAKIIEAPVTEDGRSVIEFDATLN